MALGHRNRSCLCKPSHAFLHLAHSCTCVAMVSASVGAVPSSTTMNRSAELEASNFAKVSERSHAILILTRSRLSNSIRLRASNNQDLINATA